MTAHHTWSKPFHGVQHLTGRDGFRCTVEEYRTFALLTRWYPGCGFTRAMQSSHLDVAAARRVAEGWIDGVLSRAGLADGGAP